MFVVAMMAGRSWFLVIIHGGSYELNKRAIQMGKRRGLFINKNGTAVIIRVKRGKTQNIKIPELQREEIMAGVFILYGVLVDREAQAWRIFLTSIPFGNSLALSQPKKLATSYQILGNSNVEIIERGGGLLLRPSKSKMFELNELLKGITEENVHEEIPTGRTWDRESRNWMMKSLPIYQPPSSKRTPNKCGV